MWSVSLPKKEKGKKKKKALGHGIQRANRLHAYNQYNDYKNNIFLHSFFY